MDTALTAENKFTQSPDTNSDDLMKKEFDNVYEKLFELEEEALDYRSKIDQLKQNISVSNLEVTQKNYLIDLASTPGEFDLIGGWVQDASGLQQITDSIYSNAGIKTDSYLAEFDLRVKRDHTYFVMYGIDSEFLEDTDNKYTSLSQAANEILLQENKPQWKNQDRVNDLEANWAEAERFFEREEYENAETFAEKAKADAIRIVGDGFKEQTPDPFPQELIFQIVGILVVLLVVLIILQKRRRIMDMLSPTMESEEIDTSSNWKKEF